MVWLYLPDGPRHARWLAPAEQAWLEGRLEQERVHLGPHAGHTLREAMSSGRVAVAGGDGDHGLLGAVLEPAARLPERHGRRASGIALINAVGNLGGFFGPTIVGYVRNATRSFEGGLIALAAIVLLGGGLALALRQAPAAKRVPEVVGG